MLKKGVYVFLILFLLMASISIYLVVSTADRAGTAVRSAGEFVQQLVVPATAVILPDANLIVGQVQDLARLETASVELEKIITAERNSDAFFGMLGETLIFVANGKVVAGVDFAEMSEGDIQVVDPETVWVYLPEARIFDDLPVIDNQNSYVADRDTGLLTRADPELETQVRQMAEQTIREEAIATGVVDRAEENAEIFVEGLLNDLGFANVVFFEEPLPPVPLYEQPIPKGQTLESTPEP